MARARKQPRLLERRITSPGRAPAKRRPKLTKSRRQIATQVRRHEARRRDTESAVITVVTFCSASCSVERKGCHEMGSMRPGFKHLWISLLFGRTKRSAIETLHAPRKLSGLGCSFASLRMAATQDFARSNLLRFVE